MNRRTFIAAGTAALAFSANRAFAQDISALTGVSATSELTGASVDLGDTGFAFHSRYIDSVNDVEIMGFSSDTCDASVRFIPAGTVPEDYLASRSTAISGQVENFEEVDSDAFADGGWVAMTFAESDSIERGSYLEVQLNAFEGYDLEVYFSSHLEELQENFALFQQVEVEGFEPFLFMDESGMPDIDFAAGTSTTTRGNSRGSNTTDTNTRGSETNTTETTAGDEDSVIEAVAEHQNQFIDETARFYEIVDMIANEEEEDDSWFDELLGFMDSWLTYPDTASEIVFPSSLADLEAVYIDWADAVGVMGSTMEEWLFAEGDIDPFLDSIDAAMQLSSALSAELRTLGVVIQPLVQGRARPGIVKFERIQRARLATIL